MPKPSLLVPARYYARLAEVLTHDQLDLAAMLRASRISPRVLTEPDATIRFSQVDRLIQRIARLGFRSDLAFEVGRLLSASAHSVVGFGMLNSANLDEALRFEARYFRLVMPSFGMRYTRGADFGEMYFTPVAAMSHVCLAFHLEAIAMAALREVNDLTGNRPPAFRLDLSIPEPPHGRRYRDLGNVRVRFGVEGLPGVRLRLLGDPATFPLAMADGNARKVAEERCRMLVERVAGAGDFAGWVAMTLREAGEELPSMDAVASMLNLSKRTFNRYLEREGTSFREISGRIQHELACERLAGGMSVTAVAFSLGFSDLSNFARAFRARAGCAPGEFRKPPRKRGSGQSARPPKR